MSNLGALITAHAMRALDKPQPADVTTHEYIARKSADDVAVMFADHVFNPAMEERFKVLVLECDDLELGRFVRECVEREAQKWKEQGI